MASIAFDKDVGHYDLAVLGRVYVDMDLLGIGTEFGEFARDAVVPAPAD